MPSTRAAFRRRRGMVTGLATALVLVAMPGSASAATITVTTNSDTVAADGQCALREAVTAANNDAATGGCPAGLGTDTIVLGPTTYNLSSGELLVMNDVTIEGAGAAVTTIAQTVNPGRVLHVPPGGAALTVMDLTITGGVAASGNSNGDASGSNGGSGQDGGSAAATAGGAGQNGGGILNEGGNTLTLDAVTMTGNLAGDGAAGGNATGGAGGAGGAGGSATAGAGGAGGSGGAVYSVGPVTVTGCTFTQNQPGAGGAGGNATGGSGGTGAPGRAGGGGTAGSGGAAGSGSAIAAQAAVTIQDSVFDQNSGKSGGNGGTGQGGSGGAGNTSNSSGGAGATGNGGNGGAAGDGGAVALVSGSATLTVSDSTFTNNQTVSPGTGGVGHGGNGGQAFGTGVGGFGGNGHGGAGGTAGDGNAIYWPAAATIARTLLANNKGNLSGGGGGSGQGGSGGFPSSGATGQAGGSASGGDGGAGGRGALLAGGSSSIVNSTFSGNWGSTAGGGGNATGGNGSGSAASGAATAGNGGAGGSGAIEATGTLAITGSTIAGINIGGFGGSGGLAFGNGSKTNGSAGSNGPGALNAAAATTITGSVIYQNSCAGTITDGGHNIGTNGCPGLAVDPKLAALASNGGPTQTMALQSGSPAIDIVPPAGAGCAAIDQRGVARPHGAACDAGAYERAAPDVATSDATSIATDAATLQGVVTANGRAATYHFEYGTTDAYGMATADTSAGSGIALTSVSAALGGLAPGTTYHFRLVASSSDGSAASSDRTFTTAAAPAAAAPGGGGGPAVGGGAGDTNAPVFLSLSVKPRKFAVTRRGGTRFRYQLSEDARVTFAIARVVPGRKGRKRFVRAGSFSINAHSGANTTKFSGRIRKRALKPGTYRATLTAVDAAGNRSKPKAVMFKVRRS